MYLVSTVVEDSPHERAGVGVNPVLRFASNIRRPFPLNGSVSVAPKRHFENFWVITPRLDFVALNKVTFQEDAGDNQWLGRRAGVAAGS